MALKGCLRRIKPLEILTDEQLESIYAGTLVCLERTGVRIEHDKGLKLLSDNGCEVDAKNRRARIPSHLTEECIRKCPSNFYVRSRDAKHDLMMGGNTTYFASFPGMRIIDLDNWLPRTAKMQEQYDACKTLDALDYNHFQSYGPYFDIEGVPPCMLEPVSFASRLRHSTKITVSGYANDSELFNIKMAKAAGTEAFAWFAASPPLTIHGEAVEAAFRFVNSGFVIGLGSGGMYGGTAPATIAGSTITNNAELLAALVLVQLVKPGTRVVAVDFNFPLDMRTGTPAFGAVESALHNAIFNQIWRSLGIPTFGCAGGLSSAKPIDFQCGYEKAMSALINGLSGANMIQLHGGAYGELAWHPALAVLDDDIAGWIGRVLEGVEVADETLALDIIDEVGPIPGHYLNKPHTLKWWRKEQFVPKSADRLSYPEWLKKGKRDALALAKERLKEIMVTHDPTPMPEDRSKEIDEILQEAKKHYEKKGFI